MKKIQINRPHDHPIQGYLHGSTGGTEALILVHGFKGFCDWGFFPWLAENLSNDRRQVIRFDFTHNGVDDVPETFTRLDLFAKNTFSREINELKAVIEWARQLLCPERLFVAGHSRGGGVALLTAPEIEIEGLVTLAGIDSVYRFDEATLDQWRREGVIYVLNSRTGQQMPMDLEILKEIESDPARFDVVSHAQRNSQPCLHIHCEDDLSVDVKAAYCLAEATEGQTLILPKGGHGFGVGHPFQNPSEPLEAIATKMDQFFEGLSPTIFSSK